MTSNPSSVLATGNAAALRRLAVLEALAKTADPDAAFTHLGLGHLQHLGGVAAHGGQLQPPQRSVEISGQRRHRGRSYRFRGGHDAVPSGDVPTIL